MKKIKCIAFDYGGVISKKQNDDIINKMCKIINISSDVFSSIYTKERNNYDAGLINAEEYWARTLKLINIDIKSIDIKKLIDLDLQSWMDINEDTLRYVKSIKNKIKTAILSNMIYGTLKDIVNFEWFNDFNVCVFSCEEKVSKPDKKIYDILINRVNMDPEYILFIDDSPVNIEAAKKCGINTIRFINFDQMKKEIEDKFILESIR